MKDNFKTFKPTGKMQFEFTDLISGYVSGFNSDKKCFTLTTTDGRAFNVALTDTTFARLMRNLDEPYQDATGNMYDLLSQDGRMVFAFGIFYPQNNGEYAFEAKQIDFPEKAKGKFRFEEQNWWANQAKSICNFFIRAQFPDGTINYDNYRTSVTLGGKSEKNSFRQETDTISRMIYGMASAFMLTGDDIYLEVAEKGVEYLRKHMRFYDVDENVVYWYHGIDIDANGMEKKIFTSEFGDDYDAIPMYEQIYALAGPIQTFRDRKSVV